MASTNGSTPMKYAAAAAVVLSAGHTSAQPYEITNSTIDNGGGAVVGSTHTLTGSFGQHDAGEALEGSTFTLRGGFWVASTTPARLCADQNGDGLVTPTDFTAWIGNFNANDLRADVNQNGSVEPTDFTAWIGAFNLGAAGPTCNP